MDEGLGGFIVGFIVAIMLIAICISKCNSMALSTEVIKLQKQNCEEIKGFNGKKIILCPGECDKYNNLELCNILKK